jgi:hypothetical protein
MARPGGNYTGMSGLDLSMGPTYAHYEIDSEQTPFRIWMSSESDYALGNDDISPTLGVAFSDCNVAMQVLTTNIKGQAFNFSGTDEMLWAANGEDSYMMYHGTNRGRFSINWQSGEVKLLSAPPFEEGHDGQPTAAPVSDESSSLSPLSYWRNWMASLLLSIAVVAL